MPMGTQNGGMAQRTLRHAPAMYANGRADTTRARYQFIPTATVVEAMEAEGFGAVRPGQVRTRTRSVEHARPMVVFRAQADAATTRTVGGVIPEIVLDNAHDGLSSYRLHAGLFRLVCANGVIVADATVASVRIRHTGGSPLTERISGTVNLARQVPDLMDRVDHWRSMFLTPDEHLAFADAALRLRSPNRDAPIPASALVRARRRDDRTSARFTTMNVVQEHLLRGGLRGIKEGKRVSTRAVTALDATVNRTVALWDVADQMGDRRNEHPQGVRGWLRTPWGDRRDDGRNAHG